MSAAYLYDVALSYVGFDALTATRLLERLRARLPLSVFSSWDQQGDLENVVGAAVASQVLRQDARVVVILYQRLWGETPSTQADARALELRVAQEGNDFLRIVALEEADPRPWMPEREQWSDLAADGIDATVESIIAAVTESGGAVRDETRTETTTREARDATTEREQDTYLHSFRAVAASSREFDVLVAEIGRRLAELRTLMPDVPVELRRTPDRCTVQAGAVGFSLSWLRSSATPVADASLLVIEWSGTISFPGDSRRTSGRATAMREQLLHPAAAGPAVWHWSAEGTGGRAYTSLDLAGQCVELLARQLGAAPASS